MAEQTNVVMQADPADVEQNKVMAVLAYFFFLIPLLAAKDSRFAMYHANQGLLLFIVGCIAGVVVSFLTAISFGLLGICLGPLLALGYMAYMIIGIVNAINGEMKPLPLIGNYTLIK